MGGDFGVFLPEVCFNGLKPVGLLGFGSMIPHDLKCLACGEGFRECRLRAESQHDERAKCARASVIVLPSPNSSVIAAVSSVHPDMRKKTVARLKTRKNNSLVPYSLFSRIHPF